MSSPGVLTATQRASPELEVLDPRLFSQDFDVLQNLWDTLPSDFDPEVLNKLLSQLQLQQNQVNTVMYGKVMAQYEAMGMFTQPPQKNNNLELALRRMESLATALKEAREISKHSRLSVQNAKESLAMPGLHVLVKGLVFSLTF